MHKHVCNHTIHDHQCHFGWNRDNPPVIRIAPGETVHAAAAKVGLMIPKACREGICGTCKVLKLGGEVEMDHNGGITEEDEAEGYILSCCSVPKGDVRIEY